MQNLGRVGQKQPLSTKIMESPMQKSSLLRILPAAPGAGQGWAVRLLLHFNARKTLRGWNESRARNRAGEGAGAQGAAEGEREARGHLWPCTIP